MTHKLVGDIYRIIFRETSAAMATMKREELVTYLSGLILDTLW
jgi:hypothetical protein